MDVIMNFIALGVIAEIDDFYAGSLKKFKLKESVGEPLKGLRERDPVISKDAASKRPISAKYMVFPVYKLLKLAYVSYYFYFGSFLTVFLSYAFGQLQESGIDLS